MRGTRAKQIRRAVGLRLSLYRAIRSAAMEDNKPEEIYMGVPTNSRLWNGKKRTGRHTRHQSPVAIVADEDTGLFSWYLESPMFQIRHIQELPLRAYRNAKRVYAKLARAGRRDEAIKALKHLETQYFLTRK